MIVGSTCEPAVVTKVSSELNHNDNHNIVTAKVGKNCVIDNNVNRTRFVYNSRVNPTCIEALMAKRSPRGRAGTYKPQVVYSRVFVASDSAVSVSSSNKGYVKHNVNPVGGANASRTNVQQVIGCEAHIKQMPCASHVNVNSNCDKTNRLQGSGDIVSPTD